MSTRYCVLIAFGALLFHGAVRRTSLGSIFEERLTEEKPLGFGVDKSFPIHHRLGNSFYYSEFINGCRQKYSPDGHLCDVTEQERIEMNFRQPAGMVNYTELGFAKVDTPAELMVMLTEFWTANYKSPENIPNETWTRGNTYTNHWAAPTKMLQIEELLGGGESLRTRIWDETRPILERWCGADLSPTSLYGIRVYNEGAVLAPHVDRIPLVISAIINVAQDVEEAWPLEVIGHDGKALNITMLPGEMILYESASVIHGRPFPLRGRYYANVFVHFEPNDFKNEKSNNSNLNLGDLYQQAWEKHQSKCRKDNDDECKLQIDLNMEEMTEESKNKISKLDANFAAATGDLKLLKRITNEDPKSLHRVDRNGWTPLTEAARGGHAEVLGFLIENGLDINQRTHKGNGGSPLWWAKKFRETNHEIVAYMLLHGAVEIPPEGHEKIGS